jgi:cytochrome c peroxidase
MLDDPCRKFNNEEIVAMKQLGDQVFLSVILAVMAFGPGTTRLCAQTSGPKVVLGSSELTSGIPGSGSLTIGEIEKWSTNKANHEVLDVSLPFGLALGSKQITGLDANPLTRAKIELGRQLYFDTRLSADHDISCASCHHPDEGYARHTQFGVGINGQKGGRNSPSSYNRILSGAQFWDGRAASLEEQAVGPIANPIEMGNTHENCVKTLKDIPGYVKQFDAVFGPEGLTIDTVGKAIAAFERCLVTGPSEYDYYESFQRFAKMDPEDLAEMKEDDPDSYKQYEALERAVGRNSMSASAIRGRKLFFSEKVNCAACHVGANLTDEKYHNLGIGMDQKEPDLGRYVVTAVEKDKGAFKTPTIRNVTLSAPYMHDGSLTTLEEVVEHYAKGGTPNMWLSDKIKKIEMTKRDKRDLVEFMRACNGSFPIVETGRLPQ